MLQITTMARHLALIVFGLCLLCASALGQLASKAPVDSRSIALRLFLQHFDDSESGDRATRYYEAFVDLNEDGKLEAIVYLNGPSWCGSGGCTTLVLSPKGDSYRLVAKVPITRTPIRVLSAKSHGWRTLVASVGGGGIQPGYEAEIPFDGSSYAISGSKATVKSLLRAKEIVPSAAYFAENCKPLYP